MWLVTTNCELSCPTIIVYNFKPITATGLKLGMAIFHYTSYKFCAPPTFGSGIAIASVTQSKMGGFMPHIGAPLLQLRK